MIINYAICCGPYADGPVSTPSFVKVHWDPAPEKTVYIPVQAGFEKSSTQEEKSKPTCSETFEWPGTSEGKALLLRFTDYLELTYSSSGESKRELC